VRLAEPRPGGGAAAASARAEAHLVPEEGLTVISDIDDTVKVTEVFKGIQPVLHNTFLREFEAVQGMPELYRQWAQEHGASIQYVSKSPPALHGPLLAFLRNAGFPVSSLHLCPLWSRERSSFKLRAIEAILAKFPRRHVVLVGDSGERDPEVYAEVMRRHPEQVVKILIRQVHPERGVDTAAAFQGLEPESWQVFQDPAEAELPARRGWAAWPEQLPRPTWPSMQLSLLPVLPPGIVATMPFMKVPVVAAQAE